MNQENEPNFLPDELLWSAGGHASDVALTALADGQSNVLPPHLLAHVHGCPKCTMHLGNAALLAIHTGEEIALLAQVVDSEARAPLPRLAIALGLVVAALGLLPNLLDAPSSFVRAKTFALHDIPLLAAGLRTLSQRLFAPGSTLGLAFTYGALVLVVSMAVALVRVLPKKEVSR